MPHAIADIFLAGRYFPLFILHAGSVPARERADDTLSLLAHMLRATLAYFRARAAAALRALDATSRHSETLPEAADFNSGRDTAHFMPRRHERDGTLAFYVFHFPHLGRLSSFTRPFSPTISIADDNTSLYVYPLPEK